MSRPWLTGKIAKAFGLVDSFGDEQIPLQQGMRILKRLWYFISKLYHKLPQTIKELIEDTNRLIWLIVDITKSVAYPFTFECQIAGLHKYPEHVRSLWAGFCILDESTHQHQDTYCRGKTIQLREFRYNTCN